MYYYHGDHLGSSNAITNGSGKFHEHVEYFPYGETWVEERVAGGENMPHKFTGKELDPETGLYYYGYRYLDPKLSGWLRVDPALGRYLPTGRKDEQLPGMGGVFNSVNLNVYHYAGLNPVKLIDPDGNEVVGFSFAINGTALMGKKYQAGFVIDTNNNLYVYTSDNLTLGANISLFGASYFYSSAKTAKEFFKQEYITLEAGAGPMSGEIGFASSSTGFDYLYSGGVSYTNNKKVNDTARKMIGKSNKLLKYVDFGFNFNFMSQATSNADPHNISDPKEVLWSCTPFRKPLSCENV